MRALITGAFGFAGRFLVQHLIESGDEVLGTFLYEEDTANLTFKAACLDISDLKECQSVISDYSPECIYHLAGIAFVPDAERDFARTLAVNVGGTYNIFKAASQLKHRVSVVLVSSAQVYGKVDTGGRPIGEEQAIQPADSYSLSKAMAELVALRYGNDPVVKGVIVRPFNHIGPRQRIEFVVSNFAQQLVQIERGQRPAVMQVGNLDVKRDFTDVRDIVRGYRLAALHGQGIYNLCSGEAVSIRTILDLLIEISKQKVKIENDPGRMRSGDIPELFGSYAKAERELQWKPTITLRQSIEDVYKYWRSREE